MSYSVQELYLKTHSPYPALIYVFRSEYRRAVKKEKAKFFRLIWAGRLKFFAHQTMFYWITIDRDI